MGVLATIKATAEQTGGQYTLVEILAPEGYPGVLHVHHHEDEGFYILEGEMTFYVGDQTIKAHPGSFLFGPKDVPHAFTVDSGPARLLFLLVACGLGGPHQGDGRAGKGARPSHPSRRSPRRGGDAADDGHRRQIWRGDTRSAAGAVGPSANSGKGRALVAPALGLTLPHTAKCLQFDSINCLR